MKKLNTLMFSMLLLFMFGAACLVSSPAHICAGGFAGSGDISALFGEIMPYATAVSSGLVLVIVAVLPVARRLLDVSKKLANSNKNMQDVLSENEMLKAELKTIHAELEQIKESAGKIKKMTELGFCNMRELVEGGFAREISEAGGSDKKD